MGKNKNRFKKKPKQRSQAIHGTGACASRTPGGSACLQLLDKAKVNGECRSCMAPEVKKRVEQTFRFI